MTATAHALVAAAIARSVPHPVAAPVLSVISHFVMDCIPHWDFGTNWRKRSKWATGAIAVIDTVFGMALAFFVFRSQASEWVLATSIVASLLPDWLEAPWYIFFATPEKPTPSHHAGIIERTLYSIYRVENTLHTKAQWPFGAITQVVTVAFFLAITGAI